MEIKKKQPSEKFLSVIRDMLDKGKDFLFAVDEVYKQGFDEGFSREEIAEIVRPIARQKGFNKNQVYYLTHKPQLLEKSKKQYEELKEKSLNIQTLQVDKPIPSDILEDRKSDTDKLETRINPISETLKVPIAVEDFSLDDIDKYHRDFLIEIIHYLYRKLETKSKAKPKAKPKSKPKSKPKKKEAFPMEKEKKDLLMAGLEYREQLRREREREYDY